MTAGVGRRSGRADLRPLRTLRREHDGGLFDEESGLPVTLGELRDDVRSGRRFRVRRAGGADCTYAVLAEVLTGREPAIGSPADRPGPGALLERAVRSVLDWGDGDLSADRAASGPGRGRDRRRRKGGGTGPPD